MKNIFNHYHSKKISFEKNPIFFNTFPVFAEVIKIKKNFKADIRLFSGEIFEDVPYPSGYVDKNNKAHGRFAELQVGQKVLVLFVNNSFMNPVIVAIYPHYANKKDRNNIESFNHEIKNNSEKLYIDFHKSGYQIEYNENKIEIKKNTEKYLTIDLENYEIIFYKKVIIKDQLIVNKEITWNNENIPTKASTHTHISGSPGTNTSPPNPGS